MKAYGGADSDHFFSVQQTREGGYIVAGRTFSFGPEGGHIWVLKLDESGHVTWEKAYSHGGHEYLSTVQQTPDGGYIVLGHVHPFGGWDDLWLLKLDSSGNISWQRTYGGFSYDEAAALDQTSDGGFIAAGWTTSFSRESTDIWVIRLDDTGNIMWQKAIDSGGDDGVRAVRYTSDDGCIVLASAGYPSILKLDSSGNIAWQKSYAGIDDIFFMSILQASDGNYLVAGGAESDALVMKIDEGGSILWQKTYGGEGLDHARVVAQVYDDGYIVAGDIQSFNEVGIDIFVFQIDSEGNIIWQKSYGGEGSEEPEAIQLTADGGYILAGDTNSFPEGDDNAWVMKLDANGNLSEACVPGIVKDASATVADASLIGADASVSSSDTTAVSTDTAVVPLSTSAVVETLCMQEADYPDAQDDPVIPPPFGGLEADCSPDYRQAWVLHLAPWLGGCGFDGSVENYIVYKFPPTPLAASTTWVIGSGVEAFQRPPDDDGPWEAIPEGEVTFTSYVEGMEAIGTWWFTLPDGRSASGTFNAQCIELEFPSAC
jgi:hypothetical protein